MAYRRSREDKKYNECMVCGCSVDQGQYKCDECRAAERAAEAAQKKAVEHEHKKTA